MPRRRLPNNLLQTLQQSVALTIRRKLSASNYSVNAQGSGTTQFAFYSGFDELKPGQRVRGTWRAELRKFEIHARGTDTNLVSSTGCTIVRTDSIKDTDIVSPVGVSWSGFDGRFAISPNGRWLVVLETSSIQILELTSSSFTTTTTLNQWYDDSLHNNLNPDNNGYLAFSPSGNWLAIGTENSNNFISVYPFDESTGMITGDPVTDPAAVGVTGTRVNTIHWHPNEDAIVAGYNSNEVHAWAWTGTGFGSEYSQPTGISTDMRAAAWNPAGNVIVMNGDANDTLPVWQAWTWSSATGYGTKYTDLVRNEAGLSGWIPGFPEWRPDGSGVGSWVDESSVLSQNRTGNLVYVPFDNVSGFGVEHFSSEAGNDPLPNGYPQCFNPVSWMDNNHLVAGAYDSGSVANNDSIQPSVLVGMLTGDLFTNVVAVRNTVIADVGFIFSQVHALSSEYFVAFGDIYESGAGSENGFAIFQLTCDGPLVSIDQAQVTTLEVAVEADWDSVPTSVKEALDEIASRLRVLEP